MTYIEFKTDRKISLKKFLLDKNISNRAYKKIIKNSILVNDKKIEKNIKLNPDDNIKIIIEDESLNYEPINKELEILYEDQEVRLLFLVEKVLLHHLLWLLDFLMK